MLSDLNARGMENLFLYLHNEEFSNMPMMMGAWADIQYSVVCFGAG